MIGFLNWLFGSAKPPLEPKPPFKLERRQKDWDFCSFCGSRMIDDTTLDILGNAYSRCPNYTSKKQWHDLQQLRIVPPDKWFDRKTGRSL